MHRMSLLDLDPEPPQGGLGLTPAEQSAYASWYSAVGGGQVTGAAGAGVLKNSGLGQATLRQIWGTADEQKRGWLDQQGFYTALKLVALAQAGIDPVRANLSRPTPLPNFGDQRPPSAPPAGISPGARAKYDGQFTALGPVGGFVSGAKARELFLKSGLPNDKLGSIWRLAGV